MAPESSGSGTDDAAASSVPPALLWSPRYDLRWTYVEPRGAAYPRMLLEALRGIIEPGGPRAVTVLHKSFSFVARGLTSCWTPPGSFRLCHTVPAVTIGMTRAGAAALALYFPGREPGVDESETSARDPLGRPYGLLLFGSHVHASWFEDDASLLDVLMDCARALCREDVAPRVMPMLNPICQRCPGFLPCSQVPLSAFEGEVFQPTR